MQLALNHPWRVARWTSVGALLLLPLVATPLTEAVRWTAGDFAVAAVLLGGTALAYEGVLALGTAVRTRAIAALLLLGGLLLVWAELAVGIFH